MSKFIKELTRFRLLLAFSSRLPVPMPAFDVEELGKSMKYYPFVGLVLGFSAFVLLYLITAIPFISLSFSLMAIAALIVELLLTGALHIDGLADTSDGIFSYQERERMLEIMKDSTVGTNASLALIFYFLTKFALLTEIFTFYYGNIANAWIFLVLPPMFARLAVVYSCAFFPYARKTGMGKTFVDNIHMKEFLQTGFAVFLLLIAIALFSDFSFIPLFCSVISILVFSYFFSKAMTSKLGGSTGDTFGALLELAGLLALCILFIVR